MTRRFGWGRNSMSPATRRAKHTTPAPASPSSPGAPTNGPDLSSKPLARIASTLAATMALLTVAACFEVNASTGSAERNSASTSQPAQRDDAIRMAPLAVKRADGAGKPNILLITTDDQTDYDLKYMPRTRRLIARTGVDFVNGVSPHPLCCPARAELLSGSYGHNNGVRHNAGPYGGFRRFVTANNGENIRNNVGVWLQQAGYRTGLIGKMMNGYKASMGPLPGFDFWDPAVGGGYTFFNTTFYNNGDPVKPKGYVADIVTKRSVRFLGRGNKRDPFFLWVSHVAPHKAQVGGRFVNYPLPAPRHADMFRNATPPSMKKPSYNEPDLSDKAHQSDKAPRRDAEMTYSFRQRIRSLQAVDESNAQVIRALRKRGELDETLIIYTSDNGYLLGEHRLDGKNQAYDEALQVPFLMSGPGIPSKTISPALVSTVDITASVLAAAGVLDDVRDRGFTDGVPMQAALGQDSRTSSTQLIQGGTSQPRQLEQFGWMFRGVTTARYTWVRFFNGGAEFYDRSVDPYEMNNLLNPNTGRLLPENSDYAGVLAELQRRYTDLSTCDGAAQCDPAYPPLPEPGSNDVVASSAP